MHCTYQRPERAKYAEPGSVTHPVWTASPRKCGRPVQLCGLPVHKRRPRVHSGEPVVCRETGLSWRQDEPCGPASVGRAGRPKWSAGAFWGLARRTHRCPACPINPRSSRFPSSRLSPTSWRTSLTGRSRFAESIAMRLRRTRVYSALSRMVSTWDSATLARPSNRDACSRGHLGVSHCKMRATPHVGGAEWCAQALRNHMSVGCA